MKLYTTKSQYNIPNAAVPVSEERPQFLLLGKSTDYYVGAKAVTTQAALVDLALSTGATVPIRIKNAGPCIAGIANDDTVGGIIFAYLAPGEYIDILATPGFDDFLAEAIEQQIGAVIQADDTVVPVTVQQANLTYILFDSAAPEAYPDVEAAEEIEV